MSLCAPQVTLRLTDYKAGVAAESELKVKQLAVAMGDDHYPRLERVIAPRIGPAACARSSVSVGGVSVPAETVVCLDYSAARSTYGRRAGKNAHTTIEDVHAVLKLPEGCESARAFELLGDFAPWLKVDALSNDAHSPKTFPFRCRRRGCGVTIRDQAACDKLKAELASLKADKTVDGKTAYAKAVALHADIHGQQMPGQHPVTEILTSNSILDLLHAMELNLPKVAMKYSILDPPVLTEDLRLVIGDFPLGDRLPARRAQQGEPRPQPQVVPRLGLAL
jgi:hypothetical protein